MLRVYWACPGVSAMMNRRLGVAKWRYATSIVMPCSRSARRPSVSSARSISPLRLAAVTCSIVSACSDFAS